MSVSFSIRRLNDPAESTPRRALISRPLHVPPCAFFRVNHAPLPRAPLGSLRPARVALSGGSSASLCSCVRSRALCGLPAFAEPLARFGSPLNRALRAVSLCVCEALAAWWRDPPGLYVASCTDRLRSAAVFRATVRSEGRA
ncbi:hypothetical protein AAFF_G00394800 [Aldrovandia affinis]|uniref:Uncharacterized protein n=1 Tax=Aldrovandia affinis TaxID=143900 RepID=A0AAD7SDQ4_9TELE|nr:hypothetical protein AAFF_G00394800 [Aldrovandia affinis]